MKKSLRILGLASVLLAVAIVTAQGVRSAGAKGQDARAQGAAVASVAQTGHTNHVTMLLDQYFCSRQLLEIERARLAGREHRTQAIILANCTALMTIRTPEHQKTMVSEWQIDKYASNKTEWHQVAKTPSLVNHLLKVTPEQDKAALAALDEVWRPIREASAREAELVTQTPEWKAAKTQHERNVVHYNWTQEQAAKNPPSPLVERRQASVARYEKALADVRAVLSPEQKGEWDALIKRFDSGMKAATAGN